MPTYTYECKCGHVVEMFLPINKAFDSYTCTNCKDGLLKKQITGGGGVIFKGPGFYHTDYKYKQPKDVYGN